MHTLFWFAGMVVVNLLAVKLYERFARPIGAWGVGAVILLVATNLEFLNSGFGSLVDWLRLLSVVVAVVVIGRDGRRHEHAGEPAEVGT